MADIPSDVIYLSILPRLPVKSLLRFKSVSKSWQTWISSPDFIRLHSHHARSSDKNRFLVMLDGPSRTLHLHELALPWAPPLLLPYPKTASMCKTPRTVDVDIVASSEFVLLLKCSHDTDDLVLLNPSTGSYHEIPHPSIQTAINDNHSIYGLYHDVANDNYKVAVISQISVSSPTKREVTVYSYKTNSWTLIEQKLDMFYCIKDKVAVIGHLLHTMFYSNNTTRIGCFDIVAEQWTNDVPLPYNFEVDNLKHYRLCVLDGLLCVGVKKRFNFENIYNYQVWVMKKYGVKESWVKLRNINRCLGYYYLPLTYSEESRHKILVQTRNDKLFWCDIRNGKTENAFDGCKACLSGHTLCKECLVSFADGRQINLKKY